MLYTSNVDVISCYIFYWFDKMWKSIDQVIESKDKSSTTSKNSSQINSKNSLEKWIIFEKIQYIDLGSIEKIVYFNGKT